MLCLLFLGFFQTTLFAIPPGESVYRQHGIIEKVAGLNPQGQGIVEVRCVDKNGVPIPENHFGKRTHITLNFPDPNNIKGISRSRGSVSLKLEDLKKGYKVVFSGSGSVGTIYPRIYSVYVP